FDALRGLPATTALIGIAGIDEPVRQHPFAAFQRRRYQLANELCTGGEHQQQFALGTDTFETTIEHQGPDRLTQGRAAGLAGNLKPHSRGFDMRTQGIQHGALAGTFAAFQAYQAPSHRRLRCCRKRATARLCSASVDEKAWRPLPSPTAT